MNDTTPWLIVHTSADAGSIEKLTGRPNVDVAVGV
jgi:hypothetical protein